MPSIALPVSLRGQLLSGVRSAVTVFSPADLFATGSQGIWLDPSDLSTMFSDRAGTTAVTAPGTVVGLRLDKSKGLALGAELVVNGDFATNLSGWSNNTGATWDAGAALLSATSASAQLAQSFTTVAGRTYRLNYQFVSGNTGNSIVRVGTAANDASIVSVGMGAGPGSYSRVFTATGTTTWVTLFVAYPSVSITGKWDNISVRELAGNHAVAPTDAARPVYGVEPKGGRRNLLTWSEGFDNAAWTFVGTSRTQNYGTAPDGTQTSCRLLFNGVNQDLRQTATVGGVGTTSVWVKGTAGQTVTFINNLTDALQYVTLTGSWQQASRTGPTSAATLWFIGTWGTATARDIEIWHPQLELGSTATPYQRVTIAEDVTEAGVPTCHYCRYDGANNSMSTSAIDFTATDKMSVFAGVRKLSDVEMTIVELSNTWWNNTGTFAVGTLPTPYFSYSPALRGTASTYYTAGVDSTPNSRVLSALFDIAGTTSSQEVVFRADGTLKTLTSVSGTNAGTGNFGNYPLFLGRRGGATLPLNGRDYGIIVVGKAASAGEITDTETWLAAKTAQVTL